LYKETPRIKSTEAAKKRRSEKDRKRKKKDKKEKKKKKKSRHRGSISSSAEEEDHIVPMKGTWSVACLTLDDWETLTEKYKKSKQKSDRELLSTLSESFLPEIVKMFGGKFNLIYSLRLKFDTRMLVKVRFHILATNLLKNSLTKSPHKQMSHIFVLFVSQKFVANQIGMLQTH
jgi:hypothetical protein